MFSLILSSKSDRALSQFNGQRTSANDVCSSGCRGRTGPGRKIYIDRLRSSGFVCRWELMNSIGLLVISCMLLQNCLAEEKVEPNTPCICNGTFFKTCPAYSECSENTVLQSSKLRIGFNRFFKDIPPSAHDDFDPDHVSDPFFLDTDPRLNFYGDETPRVKARYGGYDTYSMDPEHHFSDGTGFNYESGAEKPVLRKVYVAPKRAKDVQTHNVRIRVPVKVPMDDQALPDVPRRYKFKKYTTYEKKPEVKMVPVTKTIIKPVGISPNQIVDGGSLVNMR